MLLRHGLIFLKMSETSHLIKYLKANKTQNSNSPFSEHKEYPYRVFGETTMTLEAALLTV